MVSSCLLGENCKYNGSNNYNKNVRYEVKRERTDNIDNTADANDIFAQ